MCVCWAEWLRNSALYDDYQVLIDLLIEHFSNQNVCCTRRDVISTCARPTLTLLIISRRHARYSNLYYFSLLNRQCSIERWSSFLLKSVALVRLLVSSALFERTTENWSCYWFWSSFGQNVRLRDTLKMEVVFIFTHSYEYTVRMWWSKAQSWST